MMLIKYFKQSSQIYANYGNYLINYAENIFLMCRNGFFRKKIHKKHQSYDLITYDCLKQSAGI